jgi:hypothetical protein
MRSGSSGAGCLDASFGVSAMRARECRLCWALSIIAPSVNLLPRTRRKPSTIRGAAPNVVIGQSTAARAGAHPYRAGEVARSYHSDSVYQRFNSNRNKGLRVGSFLVRTLLGQEWVCPLRRFPGFPADSQGRSKNGVETYSAGSRGSASRAIRARTSHGKREGVQTSEFGFDLQRTSGSAVELRTSVYSQPNGH